MAAMFGLKSIGGQYGPIDLTPSPYPLAAGNCGVAYTVCSPVPKKVECQKLSALLRSTGESSTL